MSAQILRAALPYVHSHGFTRAAFSQITAPGTFVPLSGTALEALLGANPERALLAEWLQNGLEDMRVLARDDLQHLHQKHDQLKHVLLRRLQYNTPLLHHLPQAFRSFTALEIRPVPSPLSSVLRTPRPLVSHVVAVADEALHLAKDEARGPEWHARRALVGGIYGLAESHQLKSTSPQDDSAAKLLSRLLDEASRVKSAGEEIEQFGSYILRSALGIVHSAGALIR
ncbi:hypothetical protein BKA62DRAFT_253134 [Auriculariales sp. MPI-PUGE-AT-0066]|nr:hypothetical protein BKA62DRAFT_253134 [Auriculariales sp. MPI-PUGE-AT-0066]